jgi:hypothetical protein
MRWLVYLIPSLFFLICFMALEGAGDLQIARLEQNAGIITTQMNTISDNLSRMVQEVNLGRVEYRDVEDQMVGANQQMAELKGELDSTWREMDRLKVGAAGNEVARRTMGITGVLCGILGLATLAHRQTKYSSHCLLASAVLMATMAI